MQDGTGMTPARSDMRRANATAMRHVNAMAGGFRIAGYASLFGIGDLAGDRILPGAFENALRRRGAGGVRMLYQHDQGQPVGVWTMIREDRIGLYVEGELTPGVARADEAGLLIRAGALDGLSIGFRCIKAHRPRRGSSAGRLIREADLLEISIVTFPMLPGARVRRIAPQPELQCAMAERSHKPERMAARLVQASDSLMTFTSEKRKK